MKNFWLERRKKKILANRLNQIDQLIKRSINRRLKGGASWQTKKDTKTQP